MKCIRVLADVNQIKQCKKAIHSIEDRIRFVANALDLTGSEVRLKILFLLHREGKCVLAILAIY